MLDDESFREGCWTSDEVLLTVEAYQQISAGTDRSSTITALAKELKRKDSAVGAAVDAVGGQPRAARTLQALADAFAGDPKEVQRLAQCVRTARKALASVK